MLLTIINAGAGVEVVQPQHTQLADVALPELDAGARGGGGDYVRQPSDAAAAVAAAGSALAAEQTSRAAHDILAAAKTVRRCHTDAALCDTILSHSLRSSPPSH